MAEKKNEVAEKKEFTTNISEWTNTITGLVTRDFESCGVQFDEYSKKCAMSAMTNIYQLVKNTDKADMRNIDTSNLREIVGQCASLQLNANAVPRECYFQLRTKKVGSEYVKVVEMGIEGDGNDALLRRHGADVKQVYPCWIIKETDTYTPPRHKGLELTPPEWEESAEPGKIVRVVYPVELKSGKVEYLTADRDSVKINLFAHVRNNLMNETFGICKSRYDATPKQKADIEAKKETIYAELRKCKTVDEMLSCEPAIPYISAAWLDTPESMIVRKMRNNAIKKFPKDLNTMASKSLLEMDETYKEVTEDVVENANTEQFEEPEVETVQGEVVADADYKEADLGMSEEIKNARPPFD